MTPAAIICEVAADGVILALSSAGTIKATGDQVAVTRWLPVLREHKPDILAALAKRDPPPLSPASESRRQKSPRHTGPRRHPLRRPGRGPEHRSGGHGPDHPGRYVRRAHPYRDVLIPIDRYDPFEVLAIVNEWEREDAAPDRLWWRVAIVEPGGRVVEVDAPSGWTLAECTAYAARYHGAGCTVTPIAPLPTPRAATCLIRSTS